MFSVRCKNDVTDRQNDRQGDYYCMPRGSAHRGIIMLFHIKMLFHISDPILENREYRADFENGVIGTWQ